MLAFFCVSSSRKRVSMYTSKTRHEKLFNSDCNRRKSCDGKTRRGFLQWKGADEFRAPSALSMPSCLRFSRRTKAALKYVCAAGFCCCSLKACFVALSRRLRVCLQKASMKKIRRNFSCARSESRGLKVKVRRRCGKEAEHIRQRECTLCVSLSTPQLHRKIKVARDSHSRDFFSFSLLSAFCTYTHARLCTCKNDTEKFSFHFRRKTKMRLAV